MVEPLSWVVMGVGGEDPILTPGGRPRFREEEISTIGSMIKKWEQMEKEEGGEEQEKKDGRRSSGWRVSDLLV